MTALLTAFALSFVASLTLERWACGLRSFRMPLGAFGLRLLLHVGLFAAAFALSWRPWHAGFVVAAASLFFGIGDAMKRRILGEPLLFSDFALVKLAIEHPKLYYADRLKSPRALGLFAAVAAATIAWFWFEPSIRPDGGAPELLPLPPLVALAVFLLLRTESSSRWAKRLLGEAPPDAEADVDRFGLGGAMLLHWLAWRRAERPSAAARAAELEAPALRRAEDGPGIVVAIQSESFLDLARRGLPGPDLPAWRAITERSLAWGRCETSAAEGAYTMRSEFGFLTGLPASTLGLDAFDPYLTAPAYTSASIARRFVRSGRRTALIHPYDRHFFERDRLSPELGFERFIDGDAFVEADRCGPYVSDGALGQRIVEEITEARRPTFLFAVSIENHGPWGPGRLPDVDDPAEQYAQHLRNADAMLGLVFAALEGRRDGAVLCLYGDHAPARTLHPDSADRRATDYLLWDSRDEPTGRIPERRLTVDALGRLFRSRC